MAFTGDLEHLPIVDVIQLLHSTRKAGVLRVKSRKGESQLVFKDGYIVSANHLNNSIRIGQVLLDLKVITPELLEQALQEQNSAGEERKPLIVTLVEKGMVKESDAYKGLEHLIEMTIVEILTWKKGTFILDMVSSSVSDEYRYYPEKMTKEINVDTQSVLMESLRIFDEKIRDGELSEESGEEYTGSEDNDSILSEDLLGLADLDVLEKKQPKVFSSVAIFDPTVMHRTKLRETLPGLSPAEEDALAGFLGKYAGESGDAHLPNNPAATILLLADDVFFTYGITSVCEQSGMRVHTCSDTGSLNQHLSCIRHPGSSTFLIIDMAETTSRESSDERLSLASTARGRNPGLFTIQLVAPDHCAPALHAYREGVRAVLPRPVLTAGNTDFVQDTITFLSVLPVYLEQQMAREKAPLAIVGAGMALLGSVRETPELALALLQLVAEQFDRSLTLIVRDSELIAEKGIGIKGEKSAGASSPMGFKIPLKENSIFKNVIEKGKPYYGECRDGIVKDHLHAVIGKPADSGCLLLPLKSRGKTISLIYGDFGNCENRAVNMEILELLATHADLILENLLYRKKASPPAQK